MIKIYSDSLKGWQAAIEEIGNLKPGDKIVITGDTAKEYIGDQEWVEERNKTNTVGLKRT